MESGKLLKDITVRIRALREGVLTDEGIAVEVCAVVEKYIRETTPKISFELNEKENMEFEKFRTKMNKKYKKKEALPNPRGYYEYCFTPTGIGTSITIKRSTGEEIDVTDVESW